MDAYLPEIFLFLMGLAILAYVVLDGYDLGVGILLARAEDAEKNIMIASIGPFWDANETWLVLGVGILLTVFPLAHGEILGALYFPVVVMLIGLTLRGVAFDFRTKVREGHRRFWDQMFALGSLLAALAQGFMLGLHITGYRYQFSSVAFASFIALALAAGYCLLGATWLMMKTEGVLQNKARIWAQASLGLTALGVVAVSVATPLVSARIFERWFAWPNLLYLAPVPLLSVCAFAICFWRLRSMQKCPDGSQIARHAWRPFAMTVLIFLLAFIGLSYSLFPYLVMDRLTLWEAATDVPTMRLILLGAAISLPATLAYTIFSYRVFWGKSSALSYGE